MPTPPRSCHVGVGGVAGFVVGKSRGVVVRDVVSAAGDAVGLWELCGFCPGVVAQRSSRGAGGGRVKRVKKRLDSFAHCSFTSAAPAPLLWKPLTVPCKGIHPP